ncbi:hypothetical protein [Marinobacterium rhizophilum]|uniref:hypothetical protein n=1 Tax=Marinobacterium rhizophilum TaxID=420402 RepID=UPI000369A7E7|nr:hypothetical protein [Marinobacterium rhizophilum]
MYRIGRTSAQRDEMLQQICEQIQLPLIRVPARKAYKLAGVEAHLEPLRDLAAPDGQEPDGVSTPLRARGMIAAGRQGCERRSPCRTWVVMGLS